MEVVITCKRACSKSNVPTVEKLQWSPSNPQQENQLTANHAFQNTRLCGQTVSIRQTVSTRNKYGQDEDEMSLMKTTRAVETIGENL